MGIRFVPLPFQSSNLVHQNLSWIHGFERFNPQFFRMSSSMSEQTSEISETTKPSEISESPFFFSCVYKNKMELIIIFESKFIFKTNSLSSPFLVCKIFSAKFPFLVSFLQLMCNNSSSIPFKK